MEYISNGKVYYKCVCEECQNTFSRRKYEYLKLLEKNNGKVLCNKCIRAEKYAHIVEKRCSKCNIVKPISEFYRRNANGPYCSLCKSCLKENNDNWLQVNKVKNQEKRRKYRENNKEKIKQMRFNWKINNKEHIKQYKRDMYYKKKEDANYKLKLQTRNLIYKAFKRKKYRKDSSTEKILGCNYRYFINYLLQTYKDNYGIEWDGKELIHIDHKTPLATAKTEDDIIKLCHYTNLQLLKGHDNLVKSDRLNWNLKEAKDEINS